MAVMMRRNFVHFVTRVQSSANKTEGRTRRSSRQVPVVTPGSEHVTVSRDSEQVMEHPSMYDSDEPGDDDQKLPDGVTEEMVKDRLKEMAEVLSRLGIYSSPDLICDVDDDGKIAIFVTAEIGDLAFSSRVQDPEQTEVDKTFHQFETDAVRDRFQEIKDKFSGKRKDSPEA